MIVISPEALAREPGFGPLFRLALARTLAEQADARIGQSMLDALGRAERVHIAVRSAWPEDAVIVVSGAPPSIDPAHLATGDGDPVWRLKRSTPRGDRVFVRAGKRARAVLIERPSHLWVIGMGEGGARALGALDATERELLGAFDTPSDAELVDAHFRGAALEMLRRRSRGGVQAILDRATSVRISLRREAPAWRISIGGLRSDDRPAAVRHLGRVLGALGRRYPEMPGLRGARVSDEAEEVRIVAGALARAPRPREVRGPRAGAELVAEPPEAADAGAGPSPPRPGDRFRVGPKSPAPRPWGL